VTAHALLLCGAYVAVLVALASPLGNYCSRVLSGEAMLLGRLFGPLERGLYRAAGVRPDAEMHWRDYTIAVLWFNMFGLLVVYGLQRLQHLLPLNPQELGPVAPDLAFNTAVSFASNTNWQAYGGETTLSYLTQMLGLTTQNFVSAATGIAVLAALARAFSRRRAETIGNFWSDLVRSTLYILLPLSLVLAVALAADGVVQTFAPAADVELMRATTGPEGQVITQQTIPLGPGASQIAIKQLGTNGGGFYNVNSAHPLENPTPLTNFLECLALLLIPTALCLSFGKIVGDRKQGWAVLGAMFAIFLPLLWVCVWSEGQLAPQLVELGIDPSAGNLEGKEVRFGAAASALWATATTAASNGSVNAMHDSFNPLGGLVPMWLMQVGEVVFGGVGSGLYGMLVFAVLAVFLAGLMVGRTPEYLGKKIEAFEVKMAALWSCCPRPVCWSARRSPSPAQPGGRASPTRACTASARCCTASRRPPTTTAARSPASAPTRCSTTSLSGSACSSAATASSSRCWRWPARWPASRPSRRGPAPCRRTPRCSCSSSPRSSSWSGR